MKIGEAHRTQSSSLCSANTIGAPMHPAPIGVADRTGKKNPRNIIWILLAHSVWPALPIGGGGHRCANILADRTQKIYRNIKILSRQDKKTKKRRTEQFRALRLFSSQSPINLALQTGNGNTLQKRQRAHKKINRHRSPRSGTLFYQ